MDSVVVGYPVEVVDLATARRQELEDEELGLLSRAVGDHLPPELVLRVEALRRERSQLEGPPPMAA